MQEFLNTYFGNVMAKLPDFYGSILDTLRMTGRAGAIAFVGGLFLGVVLTVTKEGGILQARALYQVLDKIINFFRSIPFIILLAALIPLTRLISGTAIGVEGAIVPLVCGTIPFFCKADRIDPGRNGSGACGSGPVHGEQFRGDYFPGISEGMHPGNCPCGHNYRNQPHRPDSHGRGSGSRRLGGFCHTFRLSEKPDRCDAGIHPGIGRFGEPDTAGREYGGEEAYTLILRQEEEAMKQAGKIIIIGAGHVGSHAAYALASQGLAGEIVLIDIDREKAAAQALDIGDAAAYLPYPVKIKAGDYTDAGDGDVMVIAVGTNPDKAKGETRMDTLAATAAIIRDVAEEIRQSGFHGILVSISNPADVIAHYLQYLLSWPAGKIISTGTALDSARLRRVTAEAAGVSIEDVEGYALGEHGESQIAAWSTVSVQGRTLSELREENKEKYGRIDWESLAGEVRGGGWTILEGKGSTEFGIGAALAEVVRAVWEDKGTILPVSTLLNGEYGQHGVYASVPAVLGRKGVKKVVELKLTEEEKEKFGESCRIMRENFELAVTWYEKTRKAQNDGAASA